MSKKTEATVTEQPISVGITENGDISVRVANTFQVVLPPNAAVVLGKAIIAKALAAKGETGSLVVNVIPTAGNEPSDTNWGDQAGAVL